MNKKIIIGVVIASLVIGGGFYLYSRNKKKKYEANIKSSMATESDAIEFADLLKKRSDEDIPTESMIKFTELYTTNVSKDLHKRIVAIGSKKESDFNTKDKLDMAIISTKVLKPLSDIYRKK